MLDEREDPFSDAGCGNLESVELLVAAKQKMLFFLVLGTFE